MKHFEIYTDKAQKKVVIVTDENGLWDLQAACLNYKCKWTKESEEKTDEKDQITCRKIAEEYLKYWQKMSDAGEIFSTEK